MSENLRVTWRVTPLHAPRPLRHCSACNATTAFTSSGRFRTNAQKKRLDVWLVYRCTACDGTWNLPILERCPVASIPPDQLQGFTHNDPAAALRHAFDLPRLARHSDRIDHDTAMTIEAAIQEDANTDAAFVEVVIALTRPGRLRLDAMLASGLGMTRSRLAKAQACGAFILASARDLRAPIADGQRIRIDRPKAALLGIDPVKARKPVV